MILSPAAAAGDMTLVATAGDGRCFLAISFAPRHVGYFYNKRNDRLHDARRRRSVGQRMPTRVLFISIS